MSYFIGAMIKNRLEAEGVDYAQMKTLTFKKITLKCLEFLKELKDNKPK